MNQLQMYYAAEAKSARLNQAFLEMVEDGMTSEELQSLIDRRPNVYGRFSGWLDKLPMQGEE